MSTISARVESLISECIISGEFPPGLRLDERQLATRFNVSRTPVREALRQLASKGMTEIQPMRGVVVTQIGVKELSEILHADCELEALCARLSAESMTAMEKTELEYVHRRCQVLVEKQDTEAYLEANREFHRLILEGAHNPVLARIVGDIRDRLRPYKQYHPAERDRLDASHTSHDAIVEAILAGDGDRAYLAARAHGAHLGNAALRALRSASSPLNGSKIAQDAPKSRAAAKTPATAKKATRKSSVLPAVKRTARRATR